MCGVAGIFHRNDQIVDKRQIKSMIHELDHRGPDGYGIYHSDNIGIGHTRLAIRDLSSLGKQPVFSQDKQVVTAFNGEIYNYTELRKILEEKHGFTFFSKCDAELLPSAYQVWGLSMFEKLEGMFALCVWDRLNKKLVLARDPVGIKPLFYTDNKTVYFGSEIKAIRKVRNEIDKLCPTAIHQFMMDGHCGPNVSLFKEILQVSPGCFVEFSASKTEVTQFHKLSRDPQIMKNCDATAEFNSLWPTVIADVCQSDVPLGVFQSAGIDSCLITQELNKNHRDKIDQLYCATFSEAKYDEIKEFISEIYYDSSILNVVKIETEHQCEKTFREIVWANDGQIADSSSFAMHQLARHASKTNKVVLSGDGADEFFGGYSTYFASEVAQLINRFFPPGLARNLSSCLGAHIGAQRDVRSWAEIAIRFLDGISEHRDFYHGEWRKYTTDQDRQKLYGPNLKELNFVGSHSYFSESFSKFSGSLIDKCLLVDQSYYLPGMLLPKVDYTSMSNGLEVRVPFLDRRIIDLASKIHSKALMPLLSKNKAPLRSALASYQMSPRVTSKKKTGFNVPMAKILRGGLRRLGDDHLCNNVDQLSAYFNPDEVIKIWKQHQNNEKDNSYKIWALLTLSSICRRA